MLTKAIVWFFIFNIILEPLKKFRRAIQERFNFFHENFRIDYILIEEIKNFQEFDIGCLVSKHSLDTIKKFEFFRRAILSNEPNLVIFVTIALLFNLKFSFSKSTSQKWKNDQS